MIRNNIFLFLVLIGNVFLNAKEPSTVISSDRMRMLRFHGHNEFLFIGNVHIKNTNFTGTCERMWVFSVPSSEESALGNFKFWTYVFSPIPLTQLKTSPLLLIQSYAKTFPLQLIQSHANTPPKFQQIGQIKIIIGWGRVQLETEDPVTGEKKRSFSGKAVVYPGSGKMILSENPVVYSSTQGTFRGGNIIFYRSSKHIQVENETPGQRSQVLLGE